MELHSRLNLHYTVRTILCISRKQFSLILLAISYLIIVFIVNKTIKVCNSDRDAKVYIFFLVKTKNIQFCVPF